MKAAFLGFVDRIDEIMERVEIVVQKVSPYFICFAVGYFLGVIVNTLKHTG